MGIANADKPRLVVVIAGHSRYTLKRRLGLTRWLRHWPQSCVMSNTLSRVRSSFVVRAWIGFARCVRQTIEWSLGTTRGL
jgi:hypothetical protein